MKALKKSLIKERDSITSEIRDKREALDKAVEEYKTAMEEAWSKVETAVDDYNEALSPARDWVAGIVGDIDTYTNDRSDKWQEGDRAEAYYQWKHEFESAALDDISIDKPDELEFDQEDHADLLEQLPEEVE